jgi:hypothetical protein
MEAFMTTALDEPEAPYCAFCGNPRAGDNPLYPCNDDGPWLHQRCQVSAVNKYMNALADVADSVRRAQDAADMLTGVAPDEGDALFANLSKLFDAVDKAQKAAAARLKGPPRPQSCETASRA